MTSSARVLLGDADRERYTGFLREHYAAGRLSLPELERRVELVLSADYVDEAAAAIAELPGVPHLDPPAGSGRRPSRWLRRGGHGDASAPEAGWVPTPERFRDPSTGRIMRVWVDPADGSRHYVPDAV